MPNTPEEWIRQLSGEQLEFLRRTDFPGSRETILTDPGWYQLFRLFAQGESSVENFEFMEQVQEYERNADRSRAQAIYEEFLRSNAPNQINVSGSTVRPLEEIFFPDLDALDQWAQEHGDDSDFSEAYDARRFPPCPPTVFEEAFRTARTNASDTAGRFEVSIIEAQEKVRAQFDHTQATTPPLPTTRTRRGAVKGPPKS